MIYQKAESHLQEVEAVLQELPNLPQPNKNGYYPLDIFFQSEVELSDSFIQLIKEDVEFLQSAAKGAIPATEKTHLELVDISGQMVSGRSLSIEHFSFKKFKIGIELGLSVKHLKHIVK